MNNITPDQKEYIEIDEDFQCYTGRSKRLIPLVKHFKFEYLESLTDELSSFSFLKLNFGIYTLNYIKKIEENLPIFNEIIENDIKDRGYPKEKIETIKRVQSDLIIEINNAKSKAEKTSNKSSIKDKPKKEFKDLINKKYNWNDAEIETIKKDLLRGFQNNIVFAYNKGGKGKKELFNYVILYLMKNKIIDDRNFKDSECIKVFEDLFFDKKVDSFYANFIKFKSNVGLDNSKLNTSNYKNIFDPEISQIEKSNHLFKVR